MFRTPGARRAAQIGSRIAAAATAMALAATPLVVTSHADAATTGETTAGSALPFDLPSSSALRSSPRKAFAHYITAFPQSFDNAPESQDYYTTQYLNPNGENGKHAAYGGFIRDRPLGRAPWSDPDWQLRDMETDVRQAVAAGLDGFTVDLLQLGDSNGAHWARTKLLMAAAANVDPGFKIMLMPDMTGLGDKDPVTLARYVAELAQLPSAYRLSDGRVVISPFYTERHDVSWWQQFLAAMEGTYATPVAFLPLFLDEQPYLPAFAPISYGVSNWGNRNPAWNDPTTTTATSPTGRIAKVHNLGLKWMAPVSLQDERPNQGIFDEAENTTNLRNTWQIAMATGAELVQLPTWNDYAEGAQIAPTNKHGWAYLDLVSYYLTAWKAGAAPATVRDTVYLTHRTQPVAAKPSFPQTRLMALRGGSPARDTVEALTFLTAPGTVTLTVGGASSSCSVPAGPGVCTVPLAPGTVGASVVRGGQTVASVQSPYTVTMTPYVQDLQYVAVSSGRSGTRSSTPSPAPTTSPTPAPTTSPTPAPVQGTAPTTAPAPTGNTVALPVSADSYAHSLAAGTAFGSSASLAAYGDPSVVPYLRFDLPPTPADSTIVGATLRLRTNASGYAGSTGTYDVHLASNIWDEATMTWGSRPAIGPEVVGRVTGATAPDAEVSTPLDPAGLRDLAGSQATLALTSSSPDDLWVWSKDHPNASYRPLLTLTYGPAPAPTTAPADRTDLPTPDVAATLSGSTVSLRWSSSGDGRVVGYRVHRSKSSGFVPSGTTLVASPTGTSYAESLGKGTWYYRVAAVDAAGNTSSASAQLGVKVTGRMG